MYNIEGINSYGLEILAKIKWPFLQKLDLSTSFFMQGGNNMGDLGCRILSDGKWSSMTILKLNHNNIGDLGMEYICRANWPELT
jgi:hypothetical protein